MNTLNDAKDFFLSSPALKTLIIELAQRYRQYGEFKGSIDKQKFDDPETICSLLGISVAEWQRAKRLAVSEVLRAYQTTAFAQMPLERVVAAVMGKPLITRAEQKASQQEDWQHFQVKIRAEAPHVLALLTPNQQKRYFRRNQPGLLQMAERILMHLPQQPTALPLFAYQLTGDPHALDQKNPLGQLLTTLLAQQSGHKNEDAQDRFNLYQEVNLIPDSLLNFATVQNLLAEDAVFVAASARHRIWHVPMMTILPLARIWPVGGDRVFLIENSSVFSILAGQFPKLPMVMTSGQYSAAIWALLDRLPDRIQIFYASDMDASGLGMAARLWQHYPGRVHFFGMSVADFRAAKQTSSITKIEQIHQLEKLSVPPLEPVIALMLSQWKIVYQEAIIEQLLQALGAFSE